MSDDKKTPWDVFDQTLDQAEADQIDAAEPIADDKSNDDSDDSGKKTH